MSYSHKKIENYLYDDFDNDIVELKNEEIVLSDIFQFSSEGKNIHVDAKNMPMELESILDYVQEKDFVLSNVDKLIFTPKLENENEEGFVLELGEKIVFINSFKKILNKKLIPKDELDMFDSIVYEAKRIENLTVNGIKDPILSEKIATEKQLETLNKFVKNSLQSTNTLFYFKNRIKDLEKNLNFYKTL